MPASRVIRHKVEIYATTLFEFTNKVGNEAQSLDALERVTNSVSEVRTTLLVLAELGKGHLLGEVTEAYARMCEGDFALEPSEAVVVAKTLDAAERNEHHEARVLADLRGLDVMTDEVWQLLGVIGTGSDQRLLPAITKKFSSLVDVEGTTALVEVTTAVPLNDELRKKIIRKMIGDLDKPVHLVEHVDPAIIGGIVIAVGDDLRDASVRTQLANMRQTLANSEV